MTPYEMAVQFLGQLWKSGFRRMAIAFAISFGAITAVLLWMNGTTMSVVKEQLTREDQKQQTDTLAAISLQAAGEIAQQLATYDDSLKAYLRAERRLAVDTTLKPLVKMMFAMSKQIEDLQAVQRTTQNQVRQLPAAYDASLRSIIEEKPPNQTEQMMQEVLERLDRQAEFNTRIDSVLKAKRKTIKVGM